MLAYGLFLAVAYLSILQPCSAAEDPRPFSVDWKVINSSTEQDLRGVHFAGPKTGWAVGEGGAILATRDGGATWTPQASGTEEDLSGVHFASPETGWAVGDAGTILATRDGGFTWRPLASGTEQNLYGVHFAGPETGWAIGARGTILATRDGGFTWRPQASSTEQALGGVHFVGPETGWAVGLRGTILATRDGGVTWTPQTSGAEQTLWRVHFASSETGWAVGRGGTILATRDGGATWTRQASGTAQDLRGVHFASPETGWAVGEGGTILATRDGGVTWTRQASETWQDLGVVRFAGPETGWAVGEGGTILATRDGGVTWTSPASGTEHDLGGVHFAGLETGWTVGEGGTILATRDGGATWTPQASGTEEDLRGVDFASPGTGWAVGDGGTILGTRDGGASWTPQASGTDESLMGVHFASPEIGWTVGDGGTILATRDGGATWTPQASGTEEDLSGVHFASPETGWAVGEGGTILATRDGGFTWTPQASGTEEYLSGVHFARPEIGWAVGKGGTILATRDGGAIWAPEASSTWQDLWGVHFAGPETDWAVGEGGTILATRDSGDTWTPQASRTENDLGGVHFAGPETGAIIGKVATILRSTAFNYAPRIKSLQTAHHKDGRISLLIELKDEEDDEADVTGIRFRTDEEGISKKSGWRSINEIPKRDGNGRWMVTWDPSEPIFSVSPGSMLHFKIDFDDGGSPVAQVWPKGSTYLPWWVGILRDYRSTVLSVGIVIGVFLLYASSLSLLLWLRPLSLAHLGGSTTLREIGEAMGPLHWVQPLVRIGTRLVFNPWITTQRRVRTEWIKAYQRHSERFGDLGPSVRTDFLDHLDVLDAWVERRADATRTALEHFDLYRQRRLYVALPVRVGDPETGRLVEQPSPDVFRPLFERERLVMPIVGVGGSGKSTLACALARWALAEEPDQRLAPWRMLPVFVAEEAQDLIGSIHRNLAAMVGGEELEADIVRALLRSKRLLVIVDALSERSRETQRHVREFYGSGVPLNALVLTTRREPQFGQLDRTPVYTERLAGPTLIPFIFEYLRRRQLEGAFDKRQQLKLGDRVLALVEAGGRALSVTPLLVTLFVESALARTRGHQSLDALPASVPEVYLDYLRRLNPDQANAPDAVDDTTITRAARVLARTALGPTFVPSAVRREDAEAALAEAEFEIEPKLLVDRLLANGVLEQREIGGAHVLRFALDPVAEHLAAIDAVHELSSDAQAWRDAFTTLQDTPGYPNAISGFLNALGDCYVTYREPFHLPDLELPWQAHDVTREAA